MSRSESSVITEPIHDSERVAAASEAVLNAMTIDVEEHFQVSAFEGVVDRRDWDALPSRVEANTKRLLDLLDSSGVRATLFVLGWIAERHGRLVREVADRGHEVACHGYEHRLVHTTTADEFAREVTQSRRILQDLSGQPVRGYRAASFSIGRRNLWALDVLAEAGFEYDSSLFPIVHDRYGVPGGVRHIHRLRTSRGNRLTEVPPSTASLGRLVLPLGGGGYLRLYPLALTAWLIRRLNTKERMPAVVYVHPWEVDPEQPRVRAPLRSRFRHYNGLATTAPKLRRLVAEFRFTTMEDVIAAAGAVPEVALS
jgi:polysaccharide deacetylase family protein (PEP-CTERM system associated)